jgi:hypothetical protein
VTISWSTALGGSCGGAEWAGAADDAEAPRVHLLEAAAGRQQLGERVGGR